MKYKIIHYNLLLDRWELLERDSFRGRSEIIDSDAELVVLMERHPDAGVEMRNSG